MLTEPNTPVATAAKPQVPTRKRLHPITRDRALDVRRQLDERMPGQAGHEC